MPQFCRISLILAFFCLVPVLCQAAAQLSFDRQEINFGTLLQGDKTEQVFRFSNRGDSTLIIEQVRTSCGCTAALLSSSRLEPGVSGELRAVFDSSRFTGTIQKSIYVTSNDPRQTTTELIMKGMVTSEIVLSPLRLDFGTLSGSQSRTGILEIANRGQIPLTIREVDVLVPGTTAEVKDRVVLPHKQTEVQVTLKPVPGMARISGYLILRTDSPRSPELRVPVHGTIVP